MLRLVWAVSFLLLAASSEAQEKLRIGLIGAFTGPAKAFGTAVKNGVQLASEEAADDLVRVFYEDDGYVSTRTVAAFRKLVEHDKVQLVISVASTPSNAVAPIAQSARIPLVAWASDQNVSLGRSYVIRSYMSGGDEGRTIAAEALRRGYSRVGRMLITNDYAISVSDGLSMSFPKERLIFEEEYPTDLADFKPPLLKAKARNVSEIFLCLAPGQSALAARQAKEIDYPAVFFGCENLHSMDEARAADGALLGAWFATAAVSDDFRAKYRTRFGNDDVISGAAMHYDVFNLLHALAAQGSPDILTALLNSGRHSGAIGGYQVTRLGEDQFFAIRLVIKEIAADGFHELEQPPSPALPRPTQHTAAPD